MRGTSIQIGLACLAAAAAAAATLTVWLPSMPAPAAVRARYRRSEARLLDRRGQTLSELRVDLSGRRLDWAARTEVSPALVAAVLAAEDRRFFAHRGIDWRSLAAAAWASARGRRRGASTITMQLAARLDHGLLARGRSRTLAQKWRQLRGALSLERSWSKSDILEAYLNLSLGRGELQGVRALSRGLFGKEPHGLDDAEAMVLAALLREPAASIARVARRAWVLSQAMGAPLPEETLRLCARRAIAHPPLIAPEADFAPEAARRLLLAEAPGEGPKALWASSTLDGRLQRFARLALSSRLREIAGENVSDAALLVADNATGEVLAYVGNGGGSSSARFVDGISARRQAGSTLKPFLYALAFDRRVLTPASVLDDSPLELFVGRGLFRPNNYDNRFRGPLTARQALASSINVPAVRVLGLTGVESFVEELSRLGFSGLAPADFYGPSLALGSADVTLWDLVSAYRALAQGGLVSPLRLAPGEPHRRPRRVLSAQAAFLAADILSDRESRSATFGLDGPLATPYWTAVKTGTSKDMRDNWCMGFSRKYTVGVWVGNFSGKPMWNVSGVSGAAPLWRDVMDFLREDAGILPPAPPRGLVRAALSPLPGAPARLEWFIAGTEPAGAGQLLGVPAPKIIEPVSGTIVAVDPDIPAQNQRVLFAAQGPADGLRWRLDGADLGAALPDSGASPEPGRHTLALLDSSGRTVDSAVFEVRGAAPAGPDDLAEPEDPPAAPSEL
ncbi:MAG: penicillin-binding protein 1C [Elusimicrobia bacterium]|nr:penicillin-binding protein 1C [Elusimicrobiota bacterium]